MAALLESRRFNPAPWGLPDTVTLQTFCFMHLNVELPPDNKSEAVPWWLALVISVPLVVITLAIIKIAQVMHEKRMREKAERRAMQKKSKYQNQ